MPTLTFISNGHGEDVIGAQLAREIARRRSDLVLRAYPIVGDGAPYEGAGVTVMGARRRLPSGGFTLHSWDYLRRDLRAGFVSMTLRQLTDLARLRSDVLLVIGDLYAQALAAVSRARVRFVLQPLVSEWLSRGADGPPNRYFMERISYPERALMRQLAERVYVRDPRTAEVLRARGVPQALALGNPMVDAVQGRPIATLAARRPLVALIPGTRAHTPRALAVMMAALARCPEVTGVVAWAGSALPEISQWQPHPSSGGAAAEGLTHVFARGEQRVFVFEGRFADVLASADAALGTAGTANEQAAALGLPVVSFPLPPSYTAAYVRNQKRLLGSALLTSSAEPQRLAADLRRALADAALRAAAAQAGLERMGAPGGSRAIVDDLLERARALGVLSGEQPTNVGR